MKTRVDPADSSRAAAFGLWMGSPQPMVTLVKTLDVGPLMRKSRRTGMKFNMLLCHCIGRAASGVSEFYTLPVGRELYRYDGLGIGVILANSRGGINSCDIPFSEKLDAFVADYARLTSACALECRDIPDEEHMVVGTSAMPQTELDVVVNQYAGPVLCNPMLMWGRVRRGVFKTTLPVSMQFHHVQMDGAHAALFLQRLQDTIHGVG